MVTLALTSIITIFMTAGFAHSAVASKQLCISCHPVHYDKRGTCVDCHLGNPASSRKNIAHAGLRAAAYSLFTLGDKTYITNGELLFQKLSCRRCHISNGRGNRLATSLDIGAKRKTATDIALAISNPANGMPNFRLCKDQISLLVNTILAGSITNKDAAVEKPLQVHFSNSKEVSEDIFTRKCGSCHRMINQEKGSLGVGNVAPNLSGILTPYYPHTLKGDSKWTFEKVAKWLNNPRNIKPVAIMKPLKLQVFELKELEKIMGIKTN